jgi:hypothetical protein
MANQGLSPDKDSGIGANELGILLKIHAEERDHFRHHMTQRTSIANFLVTISAAIVGLLANSGVSSRMWPLPTLLCGIGLYGFIINWKLNERGSLHDKFSDRIFYYLDRTYPDANLKRLFDQATSLNNRSFRLIHFLSLNLVWQLLYGVMFLGGIALLMFSPPYKP